MEFTKEQEIQIYHFPLNYIKMCHKATEIQIRKFEDNSFMGMDIVAIHAQLKEPEKYPKYVVGEYNVNYVDKWHRLSDKNAEYKLRGFECGVWTVPLLKEHYFYGSPEVKILYEYIWLPTQKQMQEMLIDTLNNFRHISYLFTTWLNSEQWQTHQSILMSFEELWLAFIMLKKYNKIWNGKQWTEQ